MEKHNFGQFVELLDSLKYKDHESELHQISEILETFDSKWDGKSPSDKYPIALANWIQEKGVDNFVTLLNGVEMSTHHLGGDDMVALVEDVLCQTASGKYKFFYTWYGAGAHAVAIGSTFRLDNDFKIMVEFNKNKRPVEGEVPNEDVVMVMEQIFK